MLFVIALLAILRIVFATSIFRWLVRHRLPIAIALVLACVALSLNGSSIASVASLTDNEPFQGTILGVPRGVRSDEWLVFTPFSFSQASVGNPAVSELVRGTATDMTMVYAQPSWALATLFRPFLWGYLILGPERGLAFFWSSRTAALFLVTYEMVGLLTDFDDHLSAMGAILVVFSPAVQWWFAVNGSVELLVFGQGLVLALHRLLRCHGPRTRPVLWGLSGLMSWMMGCYLFVLYPAWQVPFFYVFAALGLWDLIEWTGGSVREARRSRLRAIALPALVCLAILIGCVACCFWLSRDAIASVSNTVYPGARDETGGGLLTCLPNLTTNLASVIDPEHVKGADDTLNVCEVATYTALFPLGLILAIRQVWQRRDRASTALLIAYALLAFYGLMGLPQPMARMLLLSNTPTYRLPQALGFLDVLLLVRAVSARDSHQTEGQKRHVSSVSLPLAIVTSIVLAGTSALVSTLATEVMAPWLIIVQFGTTLILSLGATLPLADADRSEGVLTPHSRGKLLLMGAMIVLLNGLFVNPLQQGASALTESDLVATANVISAEDPDARWVTNSEFLGQVLVANGVPTTNSVNTYPQLELWHRIDPDRRYEDVYNRYAFIRFEILPSGEEASFELLGADLICVRVSPEDLGRLGVTYYVTKDDLPVDFFSVAREVGDFTIYHLDA